MANFNRDIMNMTPVRESAGATMRVIDAAQDMTPEQQVIGITCAFKLMLDRFGVDAQDAFTLTNNIMNHAQGRRAEFDAVREYMENEV